MTQKPRDTDRIIDRIRKLLDRSRSQNMHESQVATDMAHKLMTEHNLTLKDISGENSPIGEHVIESNRFLEPWRWGLLTACAWRFYGHTVRIEESYGGNEKKKILATIIANKTDINAITYIYDYLETAIDNEADSRVQKMKLHGIMQVESFKRGAVMALQERLLHRVDNNMLKTRKETLSKGALVIVKTKEDKEKIKKKVEQKFPETYKPKMWSQTDYDTLDAGQEYGKSLTMPTTEQKQIANTAMAL